MEPEQNLGSALNAEFAPGTNFTPPQSQDEFQQRKQGWSAVLDQINSDPNIRMMILRTGLQMMRPRPNWQTTGGHIAGAVEDSLDWLGAQRESDRKAGLEERKAGLEERKGEASIGYTGAQTGAVRQETEQKGELFPTVKSAGEAKLGALKAEQQKLDAMAAAGMYTPEYYTLQQKLERDKAEAYTDMLHAHSEAYRASAGGGAAGKTPKTNVIDMPDGSKGVVTTRLINGAPYHSLMVPPQVTDPARAAQIVDAEVKKSVGWGLGKPSFAPLTEAEFRAKRLQELTQPRGYHMDSNFQTVPALPQESAAPGTAPTVGPAPERQLSTRDKNLKGALEVKPGEVVDPNMSAELLVEELQDVTAQIAKTKPGSPQRQGLVEAQQEIVRKVNALVEHGTNKLVSPGNGGAPGLLTPQATPASGGRQVIRVEGEPGSLRVAGGPQAQPARSGEYQPGVLQRTRDFVQTTTAENRKSQARVRLAEVRAKQKLGVPLTQGDREVLTMLGESE